MKAAIILLLISFVLCNSPIKAQNGAFSLNEIAGQYYAGDGLADNRRLTIKQDGTFSLERHGCLIGTPGNSNRTDGQAELTKDGKVVLSSTLDKLIRPFIRIKPVGSLVPLRWGERLYLVDDEHWSDFVKDINLGLEPRNESHGSEYLRDGDETKTVTGTPVLPTKWQPLMLKARLAPSRTRR